jgi:hypothetical protein
MPAQGKNLVGAGLSAQAAGAITGNSANGLVSAGTTQATALPLPADVNRFVTVAASSGTILPPMNQGDWVVIRNQGANALLVYPPVGGIINALALNAGYSVAAATGTCIVFCVDANTYLAMQAA